jgi:hypothetical protein
LTEHNINARVLGILFLTTNKAKVIDVAFESRITLMIPYPRLRSEQLSNVMRGLIISAAKNDPNLLVDRVVLENMDEYLRDDRASWINGRALKNLVKSAISLTSAQQEIETTDGKIYLGWNVFLMLIRQAEANRDQQKEIIRPLRRIRRTEEEQSGEWESTEPAKIHREHIPRQTLGEDEVDALDSATHKSREALSQAMNRDP